MFCQVKLILYPCLTTYRIMNSLGIVYRNSYVTCYIFTCGTQVQVHLDYWVAGWKGGGKERRHISISFTQELIFNKLFTI